MKLKTIITISGRISSGKSYAAKLIQNEFGFPVASFGGFLKHYCMKHNFPLDRKTLQDTGETFIKTNPKQFLIDVLSHFKGSANIIVLEGVRHKLILEEVNKLTENHLAVFVEADLSTRFKRYISRSKDSDKVKTLEQFKKSDSHSVEMETDSLISLCNFSVDSSNDKDYTTKLFTFISSNLKC